MKDPIKSFDTIKENFIRYIKTAFKTKFDSVEVEREALLNSDKILYREPWIEILPEYKSSGKNISDLEETDLPGLSPDHVELFKGLVRGNGETGFIPDHFELYEHQIKMLRHSLNGKHCIITSGTGSGKTESFLLPLLAQISKEMNEWNIPNDKSVHVDDWWTSNSGVNDSDIVDVSNGFVMGDKVKQRGHDTRPGGMRSMIIYPMNALVEDQMTRLRTSLDSNPVREWFQQNTNGNSIYFGRYNGATPVSGELLRINDDGIPEINSTKVAALKRQLCEIENHSKRVEQYIAEKDLKEKDANEIRAFFQRLDCAEMRSRFDMQESPPDILITNFSMLSIMLMRKVDNNIFDKTRQWLECRDIEESERDVERPNRIFHLIIDELHLYRGTQGTEIAYLLKMVLKRLGLHPNHPQLKILASSASLETGDPKSFQYISDFFGFSGLEDVKNKFEIITGDDNPVDPVGAEAGVLPAEPFVAIAEAYEHGKEELESPDFVQACVEAGNRIKKTMGIGSGEVETMEDFAKLLLHPELLLRERMFGACRIDDDGEEKYRPIATFRKENDGNPEFLPYYFEQIFGTTGDDDKLRLAGRGLLISRSLFDEESYRTIPDEIERYLPRFRFHYFFRNIEGMWASTKPEESEEKRTSGILYSTPRIKSEDGHRILELLYCDNCGTTFFGGSRSSSKDNTVEMLPVDPNIEGIPEKTAAKFVDRRSYQDYAVFWPIGEQDFTPHDPPPNGWWRQTTLNNQSNTDFRAEWLEASLNKFSGDVEYDSELAENDPDKWSKGRLFVISRDNTGIDVAHRNRTENLDDHGNLIETHRALPCVCPACGVNEQYRAKSSPVRGFRTGFAKTIQLFAKELVYQLPDKESQRKLVVFSDSREDAAQIANGIERNHFTDLLREILIQELHRGLLIKSEIVELTDDNKNIADYKDLYPNQYYAIETLVEDSKIEESDPNPERKRRREKAIRKLGEIRDRLIKVEDLVHFNNTEKCAPLIEQFIRLGVNPGGPSIDLQKIPETDHDWFQMFNFEEGEWTQANPGFQTVMKEGTYINLAKLFFGNLFYSLEASGLGYLTINENSDIVTNGVGITGLTDKVFCEVIRGGIRLIGHRYKYFPNDFDNPNMLDLNNYSSLPAQFRKYIRAIADIYSLNEIEVGETVLKALADGHVLDNNKGINIEKLYLKIAKKDDPVWLSPRGKRPHLHRAGGVCTQYPQTTRLREEPDTICEEFWSENYLSFHAAINKRNAIRLHCEELTGQTDEQFKRQRHFRDIILNDEGEPLAKKIDLLSVTTTLEVGVDIGALQAVMLANMPPQRFNYQQRVGRSGRRGQAYSAILTFCRGRSHDEFYFNHPHKITGDPPPTPFLAMQQKRIVKRLIAKEVLRQAFELLSSDIQDHLLELARSERYLSVHGEFGKTDYWNDYKESIEGWITNNIDEVRNIIVALKPSAEEEEIQELLDWVTNIEDDTSLLPKVENVIQNEEIKTDNISEKLAEGGVLPMFGMPTSVRNLYHEIKYDGQNISSKSIDRGNDLAIYEFAPGAQKTKDKAIHTAIGFTDDLILINSFRRDVIVNQGPFYNERWMIRCKACGFIKTYINRPTDTECDNCGEPLSEPENIFPIKSPRGYRTDLSAGKDSKEYTDIVLSRPPIFAESTSSEDSDVTFKDVNNFHASISDRDVSWRVNTNADKFFTGKTYRIGNRFPFNRNQLFDLNNQWVLEQYDQSQDQSGYVYNPNDQENEFETIALAAHKNTEILRLRPASVAEGINLNMFDRERIFSAGIRSGFYSAAFMLQRVLAEKLDVDPTEIEIADVRRCRVPEDKYSAEIILTDELPNGSGFVRHLFENIEDIITKCTVKQSDGDYIGNIHSERHRSICKDACYDCLKVFKNMNYHGLLDWRIGISILKTLNDPKYVAGADNKFDNSFELKDWPEDARRLGESFAASFDFEVLSEFELPSVLSTGNRNYYIILIHPLWDCHSDSNGDLELPEDLWITEGVLEVANEVGEDKIKFVDTFNMQRRPGWCYQKLFE